MAANELIAQSTIAAVVSDPRQPDNPIIACNAAFEALTGYAREEILGRNCRFLRGAETEPALAQQLRDAVAEARPVMVEILNYRKDGRSAR
jgi:PAS domain S-box-containing protein